MPIRTIKTETQARASPGLAMDMVEKQKDLEKQRKQNQKMYERN